ncbi:Fic family protein [Mesorhizobium sp. YIM 152430]|uniref:Fic family protein n=1 Tax=Mesorhizobium sp. YIM 152430 TaxID=3031761 RepID=UPI0023D995F2|nr:Fic family protein [Mesorhizobium sp. YIM 152430]MDF1600336.1 Fic family protein [Mesorhizobium sp. YIM 152430]
MFDPFGDFASRGYLRNHAAQKDPDKVKQLEHAAFRGNVERAMAVLEARDHLDYQDLKEVHSILFSDLYPWAGQDRRENAPDLDITKAGIEGLFSHPLDIELAANHALERGQNVAVMREKPGEIMGYLAHAHPFLDGNGRTIMTAHAELCRRAGMHIDWSQTEKTAYLSALTKELQEPGKGHLDSYLKPFIREGALDRAEMTQVLHSLPGLGPNAEATKRTLIPAREIDTHVTRAEVETAAAENKCHGQVRAALELSAEKVFANPSKIIEAAERAAFEGRIGDSSIADALASDPKQFGAFRGKDGPFSSREERQAHRNAVAQQYALKSQLREYVAIVHSIRQQLSQDKHDLARRSLQAVPAPSENLSEAIRLGHKLTSEQAAELKSGIKAFERRFGDDAGHLRSLVRFKPGLAEKYGIDQSTLQEARNALRKLDKGIIQLREQERATVQDRTQGRSGPIR